MHKLKPVKPRVIMSFLEKEGFKLVRVHGSHHILKRDGTIVVVPVHRSEEIGIGLLHKILKQARIPVNKFLEWLP